MAGSGRLNLNPESDSVVSRGQMREDHYNRIHRARVAAVNKSNGTMQVAIIDAGDLPLTIPIPLNGFSYPPKGKPDDKNFRRTSWGIYIPQVNDVILIGFDTLGRPHSLGYSSANYTSMQDADVAYTEKGGIGWGEASGKNLKPGDWSWKSAGNSSLYISDRVSLACGAHGIRMQKNSAVNEVTIQSVLVHKLYGDTSEIRAGGARRIIVPGVDLNERDVPSLIPGGVPGLTAQEHTNYVRRMSATSPTLSQVMVHTSEGEIIDDLTNIPMIPATAYPDLALALVGTQARILRAVKDDPTGLLDMYAEVIDNLGNYGLNAMTATGLMWNTPLSMWTVLNKDLFYTSTGQHNILVGTNYTLAVTAAALLSAGSSFSASAGTSFSASAGTSFSASAGADFSASAGANLNATAGAAVNVTAGTSMSLTAGAALAMKAATMDLEATLVSLGGAAATEFLVKGTTFIPGLSAFLKSLSGAMITLAGLCTAPPLTPLGASFTSISTAALLLDGLCPNLLSTTSKTV